MSDAGAGRVTRYFVPRRRRRRLLAMLIPMLAGCATWSPPVERVHPMAAVDVGHAMHDARVSGTLLSASGTTIGLAVGIEPTEWLELRARGALGTLGGSGVGVDRRVRRLEGEALVSLWPWVSALVGTEVRDYDGSLASQRWRMLNTGAELRMPLLNGAGRGIVRATVIPAMAIDGLGAPRLALGAAVGVELRRRPLFGALMYRVERVDFPVELGDRRREQLSTLSLQVGLAWPREMAPQR